MSKSRVSSALAALVGLFLVVALVACRGETTASQASTLTATMKPTGAIPEGTHESVTEDLLEAHRVEPYLVGNLLFIAHWDDDAKHWLVYDVAGGFTPDQLSSPPGVAVPLNPEIGMLNKLEQGKLYNFQVRSDQIVNIVEGDIGDWYFNAGANFFEWRR